MCFYIDFQLFFHDLACKQDVSVALAPIQKRGEHFVIGNHVAGPRKVFL